MSIQIDLRKVKVVRDAFKAERKRIKKKARKEKQEVQRSYVSNMLRYSTQSV